MNKCGRGVAPYPIYNRVRVSRPNFFTLTSYLLLYNNLAPLNYCLPAYCIVVVVQGYQVNLGLCKIIKNEYVQSVVKFCHGLLFIHYSV